MTVFLAVAKSSPTPNSVMNLACAWGLLSKKAMWTRLCRTWVNRLSVWWGEHNRAPFLVYNEVNIGFSPGFPMEWSRFLTRCGLSAFGNWGGSRRHTGDVAMINTETDAQDCQNNDYLLFILDVSVFHFSQVSCVLQLMLTSCTFVRLSSSIPDTLVYILYLNFTKCWHEAWYFPWV